MKHCTVVMLTTPLGPENYVSRLMNVTKRGSDETIFDVIKIGLVCDDCLKLPEEEQEKCNHLTHLRPKWHSSEKEDIVKAIMDETAGGDAGISLRENSGMIVSEHTPAFLRSHVTAFFDPQRAENFHVVEKTPKRVYVVLDPNAGGPSYLAILSAYFEELHNTPFQGDSFVGAAMIIVGVDIVSATTDKDQKKAIRSHIEQLRLTIPGDYPIIFIPENQTGQCHNQLSRHVLQMPNVYPFYKTNDGKLGVARNALNVGLYRESLQTMLDVRSIRWASNWFTCRGEGGEADRKFIHNLMKQQTLLYAFVKEGTNGEKVKLTGKYGGGQDDGVMVLMMAAYWGGLVERPGQTNEYKHLRDIGNDRAWF